MQDYTNLLKRSGVVWQLITVVCLFSLLGVGIALLHAVHVIENHGQFSGQYRTFLAATLMLASISFAARLWYSSRFFLPLEHFAKFRWRTAAGAVGRVVGISNGGAQLELKFPAGVTQTYSLRSLVRVEDNA
jgi:hypothetical protein